MSIATPELSNTLTIDPNLTNVRSTPRVRDFVELCKPRIAVVGLYTVAIGFFVGSRGVWNVSLLLHTLFGVGLVAVACSVLNQFVERETDLRMDRTAGRPLPTGRVSAGEALVFGLLSGVLGIVWLTLHVNSLTAMLGAATLLSYVGFYTPMKRWTSLSTVVGAVPGALPPVLGWTAAGGALDAGAFSLFVLLFLWQFPHFLAIAWLLRNQYANAGLQMMPRLSGRSLSGHGVGLLAVVYGAALIPASLMPRFVGLAGDFYFLTAIGLGAGYLWSSMGFARHGDDASARRVLWASFLYLPILLAVLTLDHWRLLS